MRRGCCRSTRRVRCVLLLIAIAGDRDRHAGADFERELRWRVDSLQTQRFDTHFATVADLQLPPAESYDVVIIGNLCARCGPQRSRGFAGRSDRGGQTATRPG